MSNPQIKTSNEPQIVLQFAQAEDRWHHRFVVIVNDEATEFMSSVEGNSEEDWPASPPIQEASLHELPDGNAVLCVGMAGKSHWSAAYSIENADVGEYLRADLACLQNEPSATAKLSSQFAVNPDWSFNVNSNRVELVWNSLRILIESENQAAMNPDASEHGFSVEPTNVAQSPTIATRWGFGIRVESLRLPIVQLD